MKKVGDSAPDFELPASDGSTFRLSEHRGQYVVLYFYPKAFTPGCSAETQQFAEKTDTIEALGASVVGISSDPLPTQCDFASAMKVRFPIVSDEDGRVAKLFDVLWPLAKIPRRVTFVINPQGVIEATFSHEFRVTKHVDDVVNFLKKVQRTVQTTASA